MIALPFLSLLASYRKRGLPPGRKVKASGMFTATQPALRCSGASVSSLQTEEHARTPLPLPDLENKQDHAWIYGVIITL